MGSGFEGMLVLVTLSLILTLALGETIFPAPGKWYPWELSPKALWGEGFRANVSIGYIVTNTNIVLGETIFGTSRKWSYGSYPPTAGYSPPLPSVMPEPAAIIISIKCKSSSG
jgi:hypothetical protein